MMHYSFTAARPKQIFSKIVKIWWFYIFVSLVVMLGFSFNLDLQTQEHNRKAQEMLKRQAFYQDQIGKINQDRERLEYELQMTKNSEINNIVIKSAIDNLLSLIPDQITINLIEIQKDALIIRGNTPSKEVFRYLLQDPLKAIFGESRVNFYMLSNGGYEFVSESKADQFLTGSMN